MEVRERPLPIEILRAGLQHAGQPFGDRGVVKAAAPDPRVDLQMEGQAPAQPLGTGPIALQRGPITDAGRQIRLGSALQLVGRVEQQDRPAVDPPLPQLQALR